MSARVTLRILGCGSSGGVPRIGNIWGQCDPSEPRNRRTRCSALVRYAETGATEPTTILIDTSPDLREQLLAANVTRLDAVLMTHDHADQSHGIDDLRALAIAHKKPVPVHMNRQTSATLTSRFHYCFNSAQNYPAIVTQMELLQAGQEFVINGPGGAVSCLPLDLDHGSVRSLGFRFGPIAYCNDVRNIPEHTWSLLHNTGIFIVDALRLTPHPGHAHLDLALAWIKRLAPRQAVLSNMHIDLDYRDLKDRLPETITPAHDGMEVSADMDAITI